MKILNTIRTHIPSVEGYRIIRPIFDTPQIKRRQMVDISKAPIIGWLVSTEIVENEDGVDVVGQTVNTPITLNSLQFSNDDVYVVECPLGSFVSMHGDYFSTLFEVEEFLRKEQKRVDKRQGS